ncbi:M15 family metallopeptidase [Pseudoalteromonas sp. CNC9-20]|uniref:M15 family metallopeptidase n=1 Tax=Pseudoalteromonas sp. CNC9-20 TaxID=2917750 RepID=UPI001EF7462C|nr:M15 family metallopeptidase [Pseudoalteromonas sp. CNC9-20]MCG7568970.1 M15 family metallopeptidase [Pseudoalteromonas sp. CNC9-20]
MNLAMCATGRSDEHLVSYQQQSVHHEALHDLKRLQRGAAKDGIDLRVASAFRSFSRQAAIWNAKFNGHRSVLDINEQVVELSHLNTLQRCQAIMLFSALPGASRHHFGTDFDVWDNSAVSDDYALALTQQEYAPTGPFAQLSQWLDEHMAEYGFYRPYDCYRGGVAPEPWHISHITSASILLPWQNPSTIADALRDSDVAGNETIMAHLDTLCTQFVTNVGPVFAAR